MEREKRDLLISDLIYKHLREALKGNEADVLNAWLQQPENMKFFMELKNSDRLYKEMEDLQYMDEEAAWQQLETKRRTLRRRNWRRYFSMVAAVVVVGVLGALLWTGIHTADKTDSSAHAGLSATMLKTGDDVVYLSDTLKKFVLPYEEKVPGLATGQAWEKFPQVMHELITLQRDVLQVVLGDGTHIWLNSGSELKYPSHFDRDRREVILRGEAYFEVAKDTARPFIVRTVSADIEVLGTSFNVLANQGECMTTLVEGCVSLESTTACRTVLKPGQQAVWLEGVRWQVKEVDTRYYTAWKEGLLAFEDYTLEHILDRLSQIYGVTFIFEDEHLLSLTYSTMIRRYDHIEDVLRILENVGDFRYERNGENSFVIKKK